MTTSYETAYIGDDLIELDCMITKTRDTRECHGVTTVHYETNIDIQTIRIDGVEVKSLPSNLVNKLKEKAIEELLG